MPRLKPTSPIAPELSDSFNIDWEQANSQYQDALNHGVSDTDAQQLYLQPTIEKWKIINSSPSLLQNKNKLTEFTRDFEDSANQFRDFYKAYSRDGGQSAWARTLKPTLQKWDVEGSLPTTALVTPQQEADSLKMVRDGQSPFDVVMKNPNLLASPESRTTWNELLKSDINRGLKPKKLSGLEADNIKAADENYIALKKQANLSPDDETARGAAADAASIVLNTRRKLQPTMPTTSGTGTTAVDPSNVFPMRGTVSPASGLPTDQPPTQFGQTFQRNGGTFRNDAPTALPADGSIFIGDPNNPTTPAPAWRGTQGLQPTLTTAEPKVLDQKTAIQFLQQSGNDVGKARQMAQQAGFSIPQSAQ